MKINSSLNKTDTERIDSFIALFLKYWNSKSAKNYSLLFTLNAEYTAVTDETYYGRSTIAEKHVYPFTTVNRDARLQFKKLLLRQIDDFTIFLTAYWLVEGSIELNGEILSPRAGVMNAIIKKHNSKMLISHLHNCDTKSQPFS